MFINPGHALHFQLPFGDGDLPKYPRPYLVVNVKPEYLYLLNVSSIKKKIWKLEKPSNKQIDNHYHYPPFPYPSFVKMDFVYRIPNKEYLKQYLMDNGSCLHKFALDEIVHALLEFQEKQLHIISEQQLFQLNTVH
ncbi:hypothetical protein [Virgibacillus oceani]|uniref:Uncharacterized protein n=1 Tax=Virgibacillus oceani TaxID=1479511 RepID=A0A917H1U6_9BACI|nr:hypothetical protein [Virgibacillus oceani]GGG64877.1 hypothetical protein GCM10011398_05640 [Virgibacillus oceani]